MDFLKKAQESVGGSSNNQAAQGGAAPAGGSNNAGNQDYGDKAFAFASKKSGHAVDPNTSEKITDGARGLYEKATGTKVDPKWSN